jgi:hypothetical protein
MLSNTYRAEIAGDYVERLEPLSHYLNAPLNLAEAEVYQTR